MVRGDKRRRPSVDEEGMCRYADENVYVKGRWSEIVVSVDEILGRNLRGLFLARHC